LRHPAEGGSLFAKVMNIWFLAQPPVVAHRNRIDYLDGHLVRFTARMAGRGKPTRILNLGCGPAQEVQRFLATQEISSRARFTLLDFNDETLRFTGSLMDELKRKHGRQTKFQYVKKSVHHLIKESSRSIKSPEQDQYDLAYCAGLFDYLSDAVCQRLMSIMYDWLAPGGLLLATNVHACNPSIGWMEHMVDWHLIYRNAEQMAALIPKQAPPDNARIIAEPTGVNVFVEITKPEND
jgi:extracellular factor (EF) 3-hydroxypalmitic acid methyl ester biosynthesis protein